MKKPVMISPFGCMLREIRLKFRNRSRLEQAKRLQVREVYLHQVETGRRRVSGRFMEKILNNYKLSPMTIVRLHDAAAVHNAIYERINNKNG